MAQKFSRAVKTFAKISTFIEQ